MNHIDPDDLLRYSIDPSLLRDAAAVAAHLAACEMCSRDLAAVAAEDGAIADDDVWFVVDAPAGEPGPRLQEALRLHARIEREDELARRRLERLLRPSLRLAEAELSDDPLFVNAGTVRVLCEAAREFHEKRPISALEIATEAYRVAEKLAADATTSRNYCMASAQRERANALRLLGRFRDALLALDEAESLFNENPATDPFDIGIVNLSRAYVLHGSERFAEAAEAAAKARKVFTDYPDTNRQMGAAIVHAGALLELGQAAEAAVAAESVNAMARAQSNVNMLARGLMLSGKAYRALRRFDDAEPDYFEAATLFEEMRLPTEVARARLQIATIAALRGDLRSAVILLKASAAELSQVGLTNEAAIATLRWAEASLAFGESDGVADKCRRVIVIFDSEGMQRRARQALAYLQEALEKNTATPALIGHVRAYIQALPRNPDRPFVPGTR